MGRGLVVPGISPAGVSYTAEAAVYFFRVQPLLPAVHPTFCQVV
jgi:hypothetical protein